MTSLTYYSLDRGQPLRPVTSSPLSLASVLRSSNPNRLLALSFCGDASVRPPRRSLSAPLRLPSTHALQPRFSLRAFARHLLLPGSDSPGLAGSAASCSYCSSSRLHVRLQLLHELATVHSSRGTAVV